MLTIGTRYFVRFNGNEKIITINNEMDLNYWERKLKEGVEIKEVRIASAPPEPCPSCQG
jgi:hypothetical protein